MKKIWVNNLIVSLITAIVSIALTYWLSNVYLRPEIKWYSRPYYKIDNYAIGNIYLWNTGHKVDHNITITLDADIKKEDIKIVDLTSSYDIKHNDNKTIIIISELQPEEAADITFKDDPLKDDVWIVNFTSEYSNIVEIPFASEPEWWHVSLWVEIVIIVLLLFIGGYSGYKFAKRRIQRLS